MNLIGLAFVFAAYVINRFVMTEATKKLNDSDKLKIFDAFSKRNNFFTILVFALILLYLGALQYFSNFFIQVTLVYVILFTAYLLFKFFVNYKKLKQIEMPPDYIRSFILSYGIFIAGFFAMFFCVFLFWGNDN